MKNDVFFSQPGQPCILISACGTFLFRFSSHLTSFLKPFLPPSLFSDLSGSFLCMLISSNVTSRQHAAFYFVVCFIYLLSLGYKCQGQLFSVFSHTYHTVQHIIYTVKICWILISSSRRNNTEENKNYTAQNQNKDSFEKLYAVFLE